MATQEEFDRLVVHLKERVSKGDVQAMHLLGDAFYQGPSGKEQNISAALPYWKMAADHGDVTVAGKVGMALITGDGCTKDEAGGLSYCIKAAEAGDKQIQFSVGMSYETGVGCQKNYDLAMKYYRMAALQNHPEAQLRLGYLLFTETKSNEAFHWLCCANLNGNKQANEILNDLVHDNDGLYQSIQLQMKDIKKYGYDPQKHPSDSLSSPSRWSSKESSGGCYVATAIYGSYDCPQVWTLRRYRDYTLAQTWHGRVFIKLYYAVSPTVVKYFGSTRLFQMFWRDKLDTFVKHLQDKGIEATPYHDVEW